MHRLLIIAGVLLGSIVLAGAQARRSTEDDPMPIPCHAGDFVSTTINGVVLTCTCRGPAGWQCDTVVKPPSTTIPRTTTTTSTLP